jgi:AraC-like DNA-binding protein
MPIIRDIVYGAAAHGASLHEMCSRLKIDVADLDDSEKHADFETSCRSWEYAVRATGDPLLGLHIGQSSNPSIMGLVGYLMQNSKTLLDAFRQVCEHGHMATNMFEYKVIEKKDDIILQYTPVAIWRQLHPNSARQAVDHAKAGTLNVFYLLSGKKINPARTEPSRLTFKNEQLLTPVLRHDRSLFKVFEELVKQKAKPKTFAGQLRYLILNDFKGMTPPIEVVAFKLNTTVRSLQRRLSAERTSFRKISSQITKEIAETLLRSTDYKVADIAAILGYSAPRSFRRAYKVLARQAPSDLRKKHS